MVGLDMRSLTAMPWLTELSFRGIIECISSLSTSRTARVFIFFSFGTTYLELNDLAAQYIATFLEDNSDFTTRRLNYYADYIYFVRMFHYMLLGIEIMLDKSDKKRYVFHYFRLMTIKE